MLPTNLIPAAATGATTSEGTDATASLVPGSAGAEAPSRAGFDNMLLEFLRLQGGETLPPDVLTDIPGGQFMDDGQQVTGGEDLPIAADPDLLTPVDLSELGLVAGTMPMQLTEVENGVLLGEQGEPTGAFMRARFESAPRETAITPMGGRLQAGVIVPLSLEPTQSVLPTVASVTDDTTGTVLDAQLRDGLPIQLPAQERGAVLPGESSTTFAAAGTIPAAGNGRHATAGLPEIRTPVQHPAWAGEVSERLQWMVRNNLQQADIQLDPPELGRLDVRVVVNNDQTHIQFASSHATVRDALESALPRLREMFHEQGLNLGNVDISQHSAQQQERGDAEQPHAHDYVEANDEDGRGSSMTTHATGSPGSQGRGLLDVFA
ncbi:MAG TPA: hypothetical protein ENJ01_12760 [Gammaproteobacteria bacterium]|nr:hypothetical protein [Gammaproteobacteria bacterium]